MDAYKRFLEVVVAKKAPMTLLPLGVEWAVAEQYRLTKKAENMKTLGKWIFWIAFWMQVPMFITVMFGDRAVWPLLPLVCVYATIIYGSMIVTFLLYVFTEGSADKYKNKKLTTLRCSLASFAERFTLLMAAFGEKSERMAGWDLDRMEEFAKAVLRTQAQIIKQLQRDCSCNPIADEPVKQVFRQLFAIFAEWNLVSGPWDPYFA